MSGISAAHDLHAAGCRFILLEARDHIGGRMTTHTTPDGALLHLGANWIHGTGRNPLWLLNQQEHLVRTQWLPASYHIQDSDGSTRFVQARLSHSHSHKSTFRSSTNLCSELSDFSLIFISIFSCKSCTLIASKRSLYIFCDNDFQIFFLVPSEYPR